MSKETKVVAKETSFTEITDSQWQVISKYLDVKKKRKYPLRTIFNAIVYMCCVGGPWRLLDSKYPKWQLVYYYFAKWRDEGVWEEIQLALVTLERIRQGREAEPSMIALDSQSIKTVQFVHKDIGTDGGKSINGRKRHIAVDLLGLPLAIHVSAANISDNQGGIIVLEKLKGISSRLSLIRTDAGYKVAFENAARKYGYTVECTQKPESQIGFIPQKGRWQVERSFAWLNFRRRLAKDYEKLAVSHEAFLNIAFISFIINRLA
jgi:transposase